MPVHRGNIAEVVQSAWNDAIGTNVKGNGQQDANSKRSEVWLDSLAERFREQYTCTRHRTFWARNRENRDEFRLNEFMFDLAVCTFSETASLQRKAQPLQFIARCHWQIESEFNRKDTREIVIDMSKLVMGAAENKLFVAAHRGARATDILEQCAPIAACCGGQVYLCFVSHPDDWAKDARPPVLFQWDADGWSEIALPMAG